MKARTCEQNKNIALNTLLNLEMTERDCEKREEGREADKRQGKDRLDKTNSELDKDYYLAKRSKSSTFKSEFLVYLKSRSGTAPGSGGFGRVRVP